MNDDTPNNVDDNSHRESDKTVSRIVESLEQSSHNLDSETIQKLSHARANALNAIPKSDRAIKARHFWQVGAVACSIFAGLLLVFNLGANNTLEIPNQIEVLTSIDEIEMLEEDIDFYTWLEEEDLKLDQS